MKKIKGLILRLRESIRHCAVRCSGLAAALSLTVTNVYADDQEFVDKVQSTFQSFYGTAMKVITIIAVGLLLVCLGIFLISHNQKSTQAAWDWMKRIAIAYLCIVLLPTILKTIIGFFAPDNTSIIEDIDSVTGNN